MYSIAIIIIYVSVLSLNSYIDNLIHKLKVNDLLDENLYYPKDIDILDKNRKFKIFKIKCDINNIKILKDKIIMKIRNKKCILNYNLNSNFDLLNNNNNNVITFNLFEILSNQTNVNNSNKLSNDNKYLYLDLIYKDTIVFDETDNKEYLERHIFIKNLDYDPYYLYYKIYQII
jgi:hypothetical protein